MQSAAKHIGLFGNAYGFPQCSNISARICVSIHIVSAVVALKYFSFSVTYVVAITACFACVARFYQNNRNASQSGFVGDVLTQLIERPFANSGSEFLTFFQRRKSDTLQIFKSNTFVFFFGNSNNLVGNGVIDNRSGRAFSARKPFQEFFRTPCAFALNGASYFLFFFTIILKFFRVKFFSITKCCNAYQAKVYTQKRFYLFHIFFNYINGLKKIKFAFSIKQVCFAFDVREIIRIVANKRDLQSAANRPDGNMVIGFVGKNTAVIRNATKWFKCTFDFLIHLVSIGNFGKHTNQQLCRKISRRFKLMVAGVMQLKLVKYLLFPSNIRNGITSPVCFFNRLKQTFSLFISRQQFYFQRKFHNANIGIFQILEQFKTGIAHSSPCLKAKVFPALFI